VLEKTRLVLKYAISLPMSASYHKVIRAHANGDRPLDLIPLIRTYCCIYGLEKPIKREGEIIRPEGVPKSIEHGKHIDGRSHSTSNDTRTHTQRMSAPSTTWKRHLRVFIFRSSMSPLYLAETVLHPRTSSSQTTLTPHQRVFGCRIVDLQATTFPECLPKTAEGHIRQTPPNDSKSAVNRLLIILLQDPFGTIPVPVLLILLVPHPV
jgi:hypothetical protein